MRVLLGANCFDGEREDDRHEKDGGGPEDMFRLSGKEHFPEVKAKFGPRPMSLFDLFTSTLLSVYTKELKLGLKKKTNKSENAMKNSHPYIY